MSGFTTTAILPATGVLAQAGAAQLPVPVVAGAARATLPFTGIAVGAYLVLALILIVVGFVLRHLGSPERT